MAYRLLMKKKQHSLQCEMLKGKSSKSQYFTCTNPIIHLFYPPEMCRGIVLDFSWDRLHIPGEMTSNDYSRFWEVNELYYGFVEVETRSQIDM